MSKVMYTYLLNSSNLQLRFFLAVIVLLICGAISPIIKYESLNPNSNSESLFLSVSRSFKNTFVNGRTYTLSGFW